MIGPRPDVILAMLAAVVVVVLIVAPLGWRWAGRVFLVGLAVLAFEVLVISTAPAVGTWLEEVAR